ncbi:PTS fructose transporter subunit IIABC [Oceanobacillus oncorhynchi]|uniref:PTS fructose transporter subunit IIABC n=1 Tax=Oceanobacillus oncorhynchi TaxID=545501 RepID=UPI003F75BFC1
MQVTDLLKKDVMILNLQGTSKEAVIDEMISSLYKNGIITEQASFKEAILAREDQSSTGLGDGIAMPHAKTAAVTEPTVLFAKSEAGIDYDSLDGQPAHLFFMIAVPDDGSDTHLQTIAALSRLLMEPDFTGKLKEAGTPDEVQALFAEATEENDAPEDEAAEDKNEEMNVTDLLKKDVMLLDLQASSKEAAIDEMIANLYKHNVLTEQASFKEAILAREEQSSTGLGDGIAMPHAKTKAVTEPTVLFAKSKIGVDYNSLDGQPAHLFFMIAVPEGGNDTHLQTLAALSKLLMEPVFVAKLKEASTPDEVQQLFLDATQEDTTEEKAEAPESGSSASSDEKPFVVAVTACPTGIAHTYMAEDALKKKAKEMNVDIKVETNGSDGTKNHLTNEDIERASGVIIAASKKVEMARFDGKHVVERPVVDGIKKAEELITKASAQDAPIYRDSGEKSEEDGEYEKQSAWGKIYKDLMNGISHMLPFVIGGGILMAISFLFESFLGSESEFFLFFNSVGGTAFNFLIPILAGYIAMSIGDRPGLMPGIVAGMMAVQSDAGFIGGLIGGFVAGYLVVLIKHLLKDLPQSLASLKPILLYPVLGLLATGTAMYFAIGPVFSKLNSFILSFLEGMGTGNIVILGILLGGMMAIDMGGPFNKAAYTFSIGIFNDTGDGAFMAAAMIGGMVPPLAIALATTFFKNKFTPDERKSGTANYIMGLSFVTEGAIPFAAADPLRVITSSVIGAAIAGGLTQFFHSTIPAPHGGIFVVFLGNAWWFFLLSLLIGTVISALILGIWKKPVSK